MKHEKVDRQPAPAIPVKIIQAKWSTDTGTVVIRLTPRLSRKAMIAARLRKNVLAIARSLGQSFAAVLGLISTRRPSGVDQVRAASTTPTAQILRFRRPPT